MSVAVTTPVPTPAASAPARRPKLKTERLSARVSSAGLNVAVLALTLAWIVPTLGLLINSFRPSGAFNTSGWWTALAPPYQFTLESYRHVLGASDPLASFPRTAAYSPADLAANILQALGIDPSGILTDAFGRPFPVNSGTPVPWA